MPSDPFPFSHPIPPIPISKPRLPSDCPFLDPFDPAPMMLEGHTRPQESDGPDLRGFVVHSGRLPLFPLRVFAPRVCQNEGFEIIGHRGLVLDRHKKEDGKTGRTLFVLLSQSLFCIYIYCGLPFYILSLCRLLSYPLVAELASVSG